MAEIEQDEKKIEPAIEQAQKPREYFQKPPLAADKSDKSISDTSGAEYGGIQWSGRNFGGGRS